MGRVFLAEQEGADFRRTVAVKIIDRLAAAETTVRRFRDEVRILASLEHPSIARFFDGGRTVDGTWFLALEDVDGQDLLTFVRSGRLDLGARIALFLQVLDAVDFAHRRLIVHRDLKPGNVLVDADGRAKLLDFGVSKILDPESTDHATRTDLRALTPAYASPEQRRGERVTVSTDVYSLGVMLYEMLAGRRPFAGAERSGFDMAALVREPELPSAVVRRGVGHGPDAPTDRREIPPIRRHDLTGDLDAITLKALRPEPESRYPSAAAFADDLRRWLAREPVAARRGGRRYRIGKLLSRHRVLLVATAAIVVAVAAGVSVALVERARALDAQAHAEATVADLHRLTQSMLFEIYEDVRYLPNSLKVSGRIATQATDALDRLAVIAGDDPRLLSNLAAGYERLGSLFSDVPRTAGRLFSKPKLGVMYFERALAIRERLASRPAAGLDARRGPPRRSGAWQKRR